MLRNNKLTVSIACLTSGGLCSGGIMLQALEASSKQRPNILLIIADDASFQHFGAYGCNWVHTPTFNRVAEEGLLFNNCYTPNAKSAPSRASILTGLYSWQSGAAGNHNPYFPENLKVVTEVLAENGYEVAFTGKGWAPGISGKVNGKERLLTGKPYQSKTLLPPTTGIYKTDYAENFKDFLDIAGQEKPWFFWLGSFEPHRGYEYGSGERLTGKKKSDVGKLPAFLPDNDTVRTDMLDYAFEIEYFDRQVAKCLRELEKRKLLDNTLVIITSDNGMPFPRCKGNNYEYSNHMPLAVMWKKGIVNPGRRINDYVNFIDLTPTFMEIAQVKDTAMNRMRGMSLCDIFYSSKSGQVTAYRERLILGRERHDYGRPHNQGYPIRAIIRDSLLYILNMKPELLPGGNPETGYADCDGSPTKTHILEMKRRGINSWYFDLSFGLRPAEELYDLSVDKECIVNLIGNSRYESRKEKMKEILLEELKAQNDPRMEGNGEVFDKYPYCVPVGVDFWEKVVSGEIAKPWEITKGWLNPTDYDAYQP
jgi:arylsulfatase A-like enzyme